MSQQKDIENFKNLINFFCKNYFDYIDVQNDYIQLSNGKLSDLTYYIYLENNMNDIEAVACTIKLTEFEANQLMEDFYYNDDPCSMYNFVIKAYQEFLKNIIKLVK